MKVDTGPGYYRVSLRVNQVIKEYEKQIYISFPQGAVDGIFSGPGFGGGYLVFH